MATPTRIKTSEAPMSQDFHKSRCAYGGEQLTRFNHDIDIVERPTVMLAAQYPLRVGLNHVVTSQKGGVDDEVGKHLSTVGSLQVLVSVNPRTASSARRPCYLRRLPRSLNVYVPSKETIPINVEQTCADCRLSLVPARCVGRSNPVAPAWNQRTTYSTPNGC